MKAKLIILFVLLLSILTSNAQSFTADFTTTESPEGCDPIYQHSDILNHPWKVSHGSPRLLNYPAPGSATLGYFWANRNSNNLMTSEGAFIPYEFKAGYKYNVELNIRRQSAASVGIRIYAADLTAKEETHCNMEGIPNVETKQLIHQTDDVPQPNYGAMGSIFVEEFVVGGTKMNNLWIYSNIIAQNTGNFIISSVDIWELGPETEPPTTPTNLAASNITSSSVNLSWGASTDNSAVEEYQIYRVMDQSIYDRGFSTGRDILVKTVPASQTSTTIDGLTACTIYKLKVRAKDIVGNLSGFSNVVEPKTLFAEPNLSITGDQVLCNSSYNTYTTTNYTGATFSWTLGPGLVIGTTYGYGAIIGGNSSYNGNSWIKVTRTMPACPGQPYVTSSETIPVYVGPAATPTSIIGFPYNGMYFGGSGIYYFSVNPPSIQGVNQYQWNVGGGTILSGQGTQIIEVLTDPSDPLVQKYFDVSVRVHNDCGWSPWLWRTGYIKGIGPRSEPVSNNPIDLEEKLQIYPNPASTEITVLLPVGIVLANSSLNETSGFQISINDAFGIVRKIITVTNAIKEVKLDISDLKPGIYLITIVGENERFTHKLIVE
jgi:chitodextrinase